MRYTVETWEIPNGPTWTLAVPTYSKRALPMIGFQNYIGELWAATDPDDIEAHRHTFSCMGGTYSKVRV